ncbi:hypothetical protein ACEPPN_002498 [Leptodophora sp. 'Broadleaf-Isolate-01']
MSSDQNRFLLITYPRTASNLLLKILALETQPNVHMTPEGSGPHGGNGYFFMRNQMLKGKIGKTMSEWTEDERLQMTESYQSCFDDLEAYAQVASAQGKIAFVKEHAHFITEPSALENFISGALGTPQVPLTVTLPSTYGPEGTRTTGNDTIFPNEFLRTWKPTILIRHPALVFPSYYRASQAFFKSSESQLDLFMTFAWQRRLHDWYQTQSSEEPAHGIVSWPVVLDADDIIAEPGVVVRYCQIIGIDPSKLKFEWAPVSSEEKKEMNPVIGRFLSCLLDSSGIQKDKVSTNIDIGIETAKWKAEFGDVLGEKMAKWVGDAMPDYEAMRARRLRA